MEVLLQRHCARYIYVVPEGLRELMSDISREVLRNEPENMYLFIADYLDALMITRENARVAARLVQSITEITTTTVEFLQQTGMERSEADNVVSIIQKAFKRHIQIHPGVMPPEAQTEEVEEANIISDIINEANISPEQGEEAALIIQRAFRTFKQRKEKDDIRREKWLRISGNPNILHLTYCQLTHKRVCEKHFSEKCFLNKDRKKLIRNALPTICAQDMDTADVIERELLSGMIDWRAAARSAIHLYRHTGVTIEEANRAATLIKAAYKGYYTRRLMKLLAEESKRLEEGSVEEELELSEERESIADKSVKINYETVIPHVDFDESKVLDLEAGSSGQASIVKTEESTTSAVVATAIEGILEATFRETEEKEIKSTEIDSLPPQELEVGEPAGEPVGEPAGEPVGEPAEEPQPDEIGEGDQIDLTTESEGEQVEAEEAVVPEAEPVAEEAPAETTEQTPEEQTEELAAEVPAEQTE